MKCSCGDFDYIYEKEGVTIYHCLIHNFFIKVDSVYLPFKERKTMLTNLGIIALQFLGTPYQYGGESPLVGLDCSSLVKKVLEISGIKNNKKDMTASDLYNYLLSKDDISIIPYASSDCILFYKTGDKITHVTLALNDRLMIEAGGGDSTTNNLQDAIERDARVRIVPIRNNYSHCMKVFYL